MEDRRWKDIELLSELRSDYNCFDEKEEPYYRALSNAIQAVRKDIDNDTKEETEPAVKGTLIFDMDSPNWSMDYPCKCSRCNARLGGVANFCPNCSEDLRNEEKEETNDE